MTTAHREPRSLSRRALIGTALSFTPLRSNAVPGNAVAASPSRQTGSPLAYPGNGEPPLLVDAAWLEAKQASTDNLLILDLSKPSRYHREHIPGAVHGWWQDTMEVDDPVYGTVLQPRDFTDQSRRVQVLKDLGIDDQTYVVVYDNDRGRWAARMVWFLRFLGHDNVSALDGGLAGWKEAIGSTDRDEHDSLSRSTPTVTPRQGYYVGDDDFKLVRADPRTLIVDVRTDDEVRDDVNNSLPLGRIPGAISFPWIQTIRDDDGRLKTAEELAPLLTAAGIMIERRIVLYARYGIETAQPWLVLALMGFRDHVIYDRGWAGWAADPKNEMVALPD